jgi:hypothetical protein
MREGKDPATPSKRMKLTVRRGHRSREGLFLDAKIADRCRALFGALYLNYLRQDIQNADGPSWMSRKTCALGAHAFGVISRLRSSHLEWACRIIMLSALVFDGCAPKPAIPVDTLTPALPDWDVECTSNGSKCAIELTVPLSRPHEAGRGGVQVLWDNDTHEAVFVAVLVPADVSRSGEVVVRFVGSEEDEVPWKGEGADTGFLSLPIMECDRQYCSARVHAMISSRSDRPVDLVAELQSRRFLWVLYEGGTKPESFLVPVSTFPKALHAAESRAPKRATALKPAGADAPDDKR